MEPLHPSHSANESQDVPAAHEQADLRSRELLQAREHHAEAIGLCREHQQTWLEASRRAWSQWRDLNAESDWRSRLAVVTAFQSEASIRQAIGRYHTGPDSVKRVIHQALCEAVSDAAGDDPAQHLLLRELLHISRSDVHYDDDRNARDDAEFQRMLADRSLQTLGFAGTEAEVVLLMDDLAPSVRSALEQSLFDQVSQTAKNAGHLLSIGSTDVAAYQRSLITQQFYTTPEVSILVRYYARLQTEHDTGGAAAVEQAVDALVTKVNRESEPRSRLALRSAILTPVE